MYFVLFSLTGLIGDVCSEILLKSCYYCIDEKYTDCDTDKDVKTQVKRFFK